VGVGMVTDLVARVHDAAEKIVAAVQNQ
jgi:hypothetical protein